MNLNHKEIALRLSELNDQDVKVFGWVGFTAESTSRTKCELCRGRLKVGSDCIEIDSDPLPIDRIVDVNVENKEIEIGMSGEAQ